MADDDSLGSTRSYVQHRILRSGNTEHAQFRQPPDQRARQRSALAHGEEDVEILEFLNGRLLIGESLLEEDEIADRPQWRPIRAGFRHVLPIIENCYLGHRCASSKVP